MPPLSCAPASNCGGSLNVIDQVLPARSPQSPAVFCGSGAISHGELKQQVDRCGHWLLSTGARKGDRVGILAENGVFSVEAYLGIIRAGLVAVPLQTETSPPGLSQIVRDAGIGLVLASRRQAARWAPEEQRLGVRIAPESVLDAEGLAASGPWPEIEPARDLAALLYTSGSTGAPKGVMVTHRNIETNTRDIVSYLDLRSDDRVMVVLPLHYCYALSLLHTHLAVGGSLVINNQFQYPEQVVRELQSRECTGLAGVPSTFQILLRRSRFRQTPFPALRWLQQAGGKLPNAFIQEILAAFPRVRFFTMYGQTEATARLSYLPPDRLNDKLGSVGRGLPSTRLEVIHEDGRPVAPGSNEIGEIVATGDNITLGYWKDLVETAKYFRNGKLHTGDLARVDAEGFIYIVEREREMIKSGGNRVGAKEVEEVIAEIADVVEVAVIGIPHEVLGEAIAAFVVPARSAQIDAARILEHCARRLPVFKRPETVTFLTDLPHNSSGKVMKQELRRRTLAGQGNKNSMPEAGLQSRLAGSVS